MKRIILEDKYKCLNGYLDVDGKFSHLPGKRKKKALDAMVDFLGEKFQLNKYYSELEVNDILNQYHSFNDPATLRRLLVGSQILDRTRDGRQYSLIEKTDA